MRQFSASKYVSYNTLTKMTDVERKEVEKKLDEKIKKEIAASEDIADRKVSRRWSTMIMIKIERVARPDVKQSEGYDLLKVFKQ